jgi:CubicO group peptidase (beta-lactamase class C family)
MVLRRIIEVATGRSLAAVIQSEITSPLQLTNSVVVQRSEDFKSLTPRYSRFFDPTGAATDVREWYDPGWVAHGFLASSAAEVTRFLHSLFAGELLDAGHLTQMLQLVPVPDRSPTETVGYGLGIAGETDPTFGPYFGHEGSGPGYQGIVIHVPVFCDRSRTIAVLCNGDESQPRKISDALLHMLFRHFHEQQAVRI